MHVNPAEENLVLSAGNDHSARISDIRCLSGSFASTSDGSSASGSFTLSLQQRQQLLLCFLYSIGGQPDAGICCDVAADLTNGDGDDPVLLAVMDHPKVRHWRMIIARHYSCASLHLSWMSST